jgi:hypothetical protein
MNTPELVPTLSNFTFTVAVELSILVVRIYIRSLEKTLISHSYLDMAYR